MGRYCKILTLALLTSASSFSQMYNTKDFAQSSYFNQEHVDHSDFILCISPNHPVLTSFILRSFSHNSIFTLKHFHTIANPLHPEIFFFPSLNTARYKHQHYFSGWRIENNREAHRLQSVIENLSLHRICHRFEGFLSNIIPRLSFERQG